MKKIQVIEIMKEIVHDLPEENIQGIFLPRTNFSSASVGIIEPNRTQTKHFHNRIDNGVEIVFIYAGKCTLLTEDGESDEYNVDQNGPVFLCVPTKTVSVNSNSVASLEDRIGFLFGKSPRQVNPTHEFLSLHIRPFTYSKLREIMGSVGFSNFTLATNLIRLKLGPYKRDLFFLSKYFPSLGRSLIVAANADKEIHND